MFLFVPRIPTASRPRLSGGKWGLYSPELETAGKKQADALLRLAAHGSFKVETAVPALTALVGFVAVMAGAMGDLAGTGDLECFRRAAIGFDFILWHG